MLRHCKNCNGTTPHDKYHENSDTPKILRGFLAIVSVGVSEAVADEGYTCQVCEKTSLTYEYFIK